MRLFNNILGQLVIATRGEPPVVVGQVEQYNCPGDRQTVKEVGSVPWNVSRLVLLVRTAICWRCYMDDGCLCLFLMSSRRRRLTQQDAHRLEHHDLWRFHV